MRTCSVCMRSVGGGGPSVDLWLNAPVTSTDDGADDDVDPLDSATRAVAAAMHARKVYDADAAAALKDPSHPAFTCPVGAPCQCVMLSSSGSGSDLLRSGLQWVVYGTYPVVNAWDLTGWGGATPVTVGPGGCDSRRAVTVTHSR